MKTLICADIHHEREWISNIIKHENPDRKIFLGDFVDYRPLQAKKPCSFMEILEFAEEMAADPNNVVLFGNHEAGHIEKFYNEYGYKMECGQKEGDKRDFKKFFENKKVDFTFGRASYMEKICGKDVLFTHAGLHHSFAVKHGLTCVEDIVNRIDSAVEKAYQSDFLTIPELISAVGRARNGWEPFGGCLWRDFYEEPSNLAAHQIFGHTANPNTLAIRTVNEFAHKQINLDGRQTIYGIIENDKFLVRSREENGDRMKFFVDIGGEHNEYVEEYEITL